MDRRSRQQRDNHHAARNRLDRISDSDDANPLPVNELGPGENSRKPSARRPDVGGKERRIGPTLRRTLWKGTVPCTLPLFYFIVTDRYIRIVVDEDAGVIGHTMDREDMREFYRQPWVMVASDGGIGAPHPRGAGTFPRVLGRFVREEGWLTLPEAIRKMTSLPAVRLGLEDRGMIRPGMKADLVLFNPETVIDRAPSTNRNGSPAACTSCSSTEPSSGGLDYPLGNSPGW
jgi:hypothetical protein